MLQNTFVHVGGIGAAKERKLWKLGVHTWEEYEARFDQQLDLFGQSQKTFELSREKLAASDSNYFAALLPVTEHYRIALEYPEDALFLDIETTGTGFRYDDITVVGWSSKKGSGVYIAGQDSREMISAIEESKVVVTFNGIGFDVPIIRKSFEVNFPSAHLDLMLLGRKIGMRGGQKKLEKQLGLIREDEIDGMTGRDAPILWNEHLRGDATALDTLIKYNLADVYGMKVILDKVVERMLSDELIPKGDYYSFSQDLLQI